MDSKYFNTSFSVINMLQSGLQGKFAAWNVIEKLGGDVDASEKAQLRKQLETIGEWGRELWQGVPLLTEPATVTLQGSMALKFLEGQKKALQKVAADVEAILSGNHPLTQPSLQRLCAAFVWYAYSRDICFKGLIAYAQAIKNRELAQNYRQAAGACQQDIQLAHQLLDAAGAGNGQDSRLQIQMREVTMNLPGLFRTQAADIDILKARYGGDISYASVDIPEDEARNWQQMGVPPDAAAYWSAYGMAPEETAKWHLLKINDPACASAWRIRGFAPEQAAEWRKHGFHAKDAGRYRDMGYTDPDTAKAWGEEVRKQKESKAEKQENEIEKCRTDQAENTRDRREWEKYGFRDPEEMALWHTSGFTPDQAATWNKAGVNAAAAGTWKKAGVSCRESEAFRKHGIKAKEAGQWKQAGFTAEQSRIFSGLEEAMAYLAAEGTPGKAVEWKRIDQRPEQVDSWKKAGVSDPSAAQNWLKAGISGPGEVADWKKTGADLSTAEQWKRFGFTPETALEWARAGFTVAEEARSWQQKGFSDPALAAVERRKSPEHLEAFIRRIIPLAQGGSEMLSKCLSENVGLFTDTFPDRFYEIVEQMMPEGEQALGNYTDTLGIVADRIRCLESGDPAQNTEVAFQFLTRLMDKLRTRIPGPSQLRLRIRLAKALISRHAGVKNENVARAAALLKGMAPLVNRTASPRFWASVQQNIGRALLEQPDGDRRNNLETAIRHFDNALTVFTEKTDPAGYSSTTRLKDEARQALDSLNASDSKGF